MQRKALDDALTYLAAHARTEQEVRAELHRRGHSGEDSEEAIQRLLDGGVLNDFAYAERYIEYAAGRCRGPLRLQRELAEKGVAQDTIKDGIAAFFGEDRELELALKQAERIWAGSAKPPERKELERIGRRLAAQGFRPSVVYSVLDRLK